MQRALRLLQIIHWTVLLSSRVARACQGSQHGWCSTTEQLGHPNVGGKIRPTVKDKHIISIKIEISSVNLDITCPSVSPIAFLCPEYIHWPIQVENMSKESWCQGLFDDIQYVRVKSLSKALQSLKLKMQIVFFKYMSVHIFVENGLHSIGCHYHIHKVTYM